MLNRKKVITYAVTSFASLVACTLCLLTILHLMHEDVHYISSSPGGTLMVLTLLAAGFIAFGASAFVSTVGVIQGRLEGKNKLPKLLDV